MGGVSFVWMSIVLPLYPRLGTIASSIAIHLFGGLRRVVKVRMLDDNLSQDVD
jgi:hypothetical protein